MNVESIEFLASYEWRQLRMKAIKKHGARCQCCGADPSNGAVIHVDHILPRKTHPELALDITNLQILCEECNHGKGNWDSTDWRPGPKPVQRFDGMRSFGDWMRIWGEDWVRMIEENNS